MKNDLAFRLSVLLIAALAGATALAACGKDQEVPADPPLASSLDGGGTAGTGGGTGGTGGLDAAVFLPPVNPQYDARIVGPEDASCFAKRINALANKPDILIVLDRSESMNIGQRWEPSKSAIKSITSQFQSLVDFGLALFPGAGDACAAGAVDVQIQSNNATAIGGAIDATGPQGYTPVGATLEALATVLGDRTSQLDSVVKPAYVLLVTDGEPTCEIDGLLIMPTATSINRANAAVERLKAQNVPTYVIGYSVANAAGVMDGMAQRGGTEHYYPVENEAQLVEQFKKITAGLATCEFQLDEVPSQPSRVKVVIDDIQIYLSDALERGWVLDGKTIKLQSGACESIRDGAQHKVDVTVECADIPPPV
jgi:Mg-chelatase subunit ChlD